MCGFLFTNLSFIILFCVTAGAVDLTWDLSPSDEGGTNFEYRVYRSVSGSGWSVIATTRTNIAQVTIVPGRNDFRVTFASTDTADESIPSNVFIVSHPHIKVGSFKIGR